MARRERRCQLTDAGDRSAASRARIAQPQRLGDSPRPAAGDAGDLDLRRRPAPPRRAAPAAQVIHGAPRRDRRGLDRQQVVHAAGRRNRSPSSAPRKRSRRLAARSSNSRAARCRAGADQFGAPALHEAQIGGVIDDAGKIGVLVIDADRHDVAAVVDVEPACEGSSHARPIIQRALARASR